MADSLKELVACAPGERGIKDIKSSHPKSSFKKGDFITSVAFGSAWEGQVVEVMGFLSQNDETRLLGKTSKTSNSLLLPFMYCTRSHWRDLKPVSEERVALYKLRI